MAYLGTRLVVASVRQRRSLHIAPGRVAAAAPLAIAMVIPHVIRPDWLLALLPAGLLWWLLRRGADQGRAWRGIVAPHLLAHLWGGNNRRRTSHHYTPWACCGC